MAGLVNALLLTAGLATLFITINKRSSRVSGIKFHFVTSDLCKKLLMSIYFAVTKTKTKKDFCVYRYYLIDPLAKEYVVTVSSIVSFV